MMGILSKSTLGSFECFPAGEFNAPSAGRKSVSEGLKLLAPRAGAESSKGNSGLPRLLF